MKTETKFEKAPQPTDFLEGEYFTGLCELAAACQTKKILYIPAKTLGIFESLYHKRIFARAKTKDKGFLIGEFDIKNRYLFNYNIYSKTYTEPNSNMQTFIEKVKDIIAKDNYKIFSLQPINEPSLIDLLEGETFNINSVGV